MKRTWPWVLLVALTSLAIGNVFGFVSLTGSAKAVIVRVRNNGPGPVMAAELDVGSRTASLGDVPRGAWRTAQTTPIHAAEVVFRYRSPDGLCWYAYLREYIGYGDYGALDIEVTSDGSVRWLSILDSDRAPLSAQQRTVRAAGAGRCRSQGAERSPAP